MGFGGYSIIHSFMMLNQGNNLFYALYVVTGCIIGVRIYSVYDGHKPLIILEHSQQF